MTKLTPEQITSNLAAIKALYEGRWREVEWYHPYKERWVAWIEENIWKVDYDSLLRLRPKPPEPKWRAWTYETCPVGIVLKLKRDRVKRFLGSCCADSVMVVGSGNYSYLHLFEEYEQLDGQPAGVKE